MAASHPHGHNGEGLSLEEQRQLWNHVRALEVLEEQKAEIAEDVKARKALAKADGFDTNVLAVILKRRKAGEGETRAADNLVRMYEEGLQEQGALPLERIKASAPSTRRTVDEIAEDLHQEPAPPMPEKAPDVAAAVQALDETLRRDGATMTMIVDGQPVATFGDPAGMFDDPF